MEKLVEAISMVPLKEGHQILLKNRLVRELADD